MAAKKKAAAKKAPGVVKFHVRKPETEDVEIQVGNGDGLRFVGPYKNAVSAFLPGRKLNRDDLALIGAPPKGCSLADLDAAGIAGVVKLEDVQALAGTGDWEHVPAAKMTKNTAKAEKARDDRNAARQKKADASSEDAPAGADK